ncbi:MAG: type I methionyl aminopeptidase [Sphingobacteriales bacterium]|nr:MAG: type I methionyl aminopeptidase [Sphingobacteriales bacterium]
MIYYKTDEEVSLIRESCILVSKTLAEVGSYVQPGISTQRLDEIAEEFIRDHGATPAFKGYRDFPASLCISVNEEVVHGIPSANKILKEGDIVSVDCGTVLNGFVGDSAYTFAVGDISDEVKNLLRITQECLALGVEKAKYGNRIGDISFAVQDHAEKNGYGVVRELVGHGVGKKLHEDPEVPNFGRRGSGPKLLPGLVIAIEPMINLGQKSVAEASDGWTIYTKDLKPSAHFEHTIAVLKDRTEILTTFKFIEERKKVVEMG